jgi:hypothetical protein
MWDEYYNYLYTKLKRTLDSAKTVVIKNICLLRNPYWMSSYFSDVADYVAGHWLA